MNGKRGKVAHCRFLGRKEGGLAVFFLHIVGVGLLARAGCIAMFFQLVGRKNVSFFVCLSLGFTHIFCLVR